MRSSDEHRVTRRDWTTLFGILPFAATLDAARAQSPPPAADPTSDTSMEKAMNSVRRASEQLAQMEVAMNIEPAFSFKP